jgi:hypothetical protein
MCNKNLAAPQRKFEPFAFEKADITYIPILEGLAGIT